MSTKRKLMKLTSFVLAASLMQPRAELIESVAVNGGEDTKNIEDKVLSTETSGVVGEGETEDTTEEKEPEVKKEVFEVSSAVALFEDKEVDELVIHSGSLNLNGHKLVVKGSVYVNGGTLNISGGQLDVAEDMVIQQTVSLSGGKITVGGDMRLQSMGVDASGTKSYGFSWSAALNMKDENDIIEVNGDFILYTYTYYSSFTAGTLKINGDIKQYDNDGYCVFNTTGTHKVILSGNKLQTVTLSNVSSRISNLILKNTSKEGVFFDSYSNWDKLETNGVKVSSHTGGSIGYTLEKDETITGDMLIYGGTLNLNGHNLTIDGNLVQNSGTIDINGGTLTVTGDYKLVNGENGQSSGKLVMNGKHMSGEEEITDTDKVIIKGNFATNSIYSHENYLTSGVMEIGGNFVQYGNSTNFKTGGTHEVVLNGKAGQTVSFGGQSSNFNNLKIENISEDGVTFSAATIVRGKLYDTKSKLVKPRNIYLASTAQILSKDNKSEWSHDITFLEKRTLSQDMKIGGKLYANNVLDISGYTLDVAEDMIIQSTLIINKGKVNVGGDMRVQSESINSEGNSTYGFSWSSAMQMTNEEDMVNVNGDFVLYTYTHYSSFTAGTMNIKGSIKQYNYDSYCIFNTSGTHKIILSGDKAQIVELNHVSSRIANLELRNTSKEGVSFTKYANWGNLDKGESVLKLSDGQYLGYKLTKDEVIEGDFVLLGDILDLNGHNLTVKGNLIQNSGTIDINGGLLTVTGDYKLVNGENGQSSGKLVMNGKHMSGEEEITDTDKVIIKGNFATNSIYSHENYLTSGVMEIGGNFVQYGNGTNFKTSGTHEVILNGEAGQTISFGGQSSNFNNLKIENTSEDGVTFSAATVVRGELYDTKSKLVKPRNIYLASTAQILSKDNKSEWSHDITFLEKRTLSQDMKIGGKLYANNVLDISGYTLDVAEDMIIQSTLIINKGKVNVGGDMRVQSESINSEGNSTYGFSWSSAMQMTNEEDTVNVNGDFVLHTYTYYSSFTAGTMNIKGSIKQYNSDSYCIFDTSGTHKIILSGDKPQVVELNYVSSKIANLELRNTSEEGVSFTKYANWGNLDKGDSVLKLSDGQYLGYTLTKDEVIEGDFILLGDTLNLNGYSLTIKGNLIQNSGTIDINGGLLTVTGDYKLVSGENGQCSSKLIMDGKHISEDEEIADNDMVIVKGTFATNSIYSHEKYLTSGIMQIGGDFIQYRDTPNFKTSGTHEVILNGTQLQKIRFGGQSSNFNNLRIENTSTTGVNFETVTKITGNLYNTNTKVYGGRNLYLYASANIMDEKTNKQEWSHDLAFVEQRTLNEDVKIGGSLYVLSELHINEKNLDVAGNAIVNQRVLVEDGKFAVAKNLLLQAEDVNADGTYRYSSTGYGAIVMENENDYVGVGKDCVLNSMYTNSVFNAGILEIKGNLTQRNYYDYCIFSAGGTHKVVLSGTSDQSVTFENKGSKFNILEVTKPIEQYKFNLKTPWNELIETTVDTKAPSVPKSLKASEKSAVMLHLTWEESNDENGIKGYNIFRNGVRIASSDKAEYIDAGLTPDTEYVYSVSAFDSVRNESSKTAEVKISTAPDTEAPSIPTELNVKPGKTVKLTWKGSNDNYKVDKYKIYRNDECIGEVNGTSFEDTKPGKEIYNYSVTAIDPYTNESEKCEAVRIDLKPPAVPEKFGAECTENSIVLTWDKAVEEDFALYTIYKKSQTDEDYKALINIGSAESVSFEDTSVEFNKKYSYKLVVSDTSGNVSDFSEPVTKIIDTDTTKPVITSAGSSQSGRMSNTSDISVNFSDNFDVVSFEAFVSVSEKNEWTSLKKSEIVKGKTSYSFVPDVSKLESGNYDMKFIVSDQSGNKSEEYIITLAYDKCTLVKPEITAKNSGMKIDLSWNGTDNEQFSRSNLYRKSEDDTEYQLIAQLEQNVYTDDTVTEGKLYSYYVKSYDIYGNVMVSKPAEIVAVEKSDYTEVPYGYSVKDGYVIITDCDVTAEKIVIPSEIEGVPVSEITSQAFSGAKAKEIIIPETVSKIGVQVFKDCSGITSLVIPKSVKYIGDNCFENCTALEKVEILSTDISMSGYAFEGCSDKLTVYAPMGSATQITANQSGTAYIPTDCEYEVSEETVKIVKYNGSLANIVIPSYIEGKDVTVIGASSFKDNDNITGITLPSAIKSIGEFAFMNCSALSSINFDGVSLESAGADFIYNTPYADSIDSDFVIIANDYLYRYTGTDTYVTIPEGVRIIGADAFADCDYIENINIASSVSKILSGAFFGCIKLEKVIIPENVSYIGDYAFSCCENLKEAVLPENITQGTEAFFGTKIK